MLVREMMSRPRVLLPEDMSLREAAWLLDEHRCDGAPVSDDSGTLLGIVTEMDLLRDQFEPVPNTYERAGHTPPAPLPHTVRDVMTTAVATSAETDDAGDLAQRMMRTRIRHVPVLRNGRIVGVVSRHDIARVYLRPDGEIRETVLAAITRRIPRADTLSVTVEDGVVEIAAAEDSETCRLAAALAAKVPGVRWLRVTRSETREHARSSS